MCRFLSSFGANRPPPNCEALTKRTSRKCKQMQRFYSQRDLTSSIGGLSLPTCCVLIMTWALNGGDDTDNDLGTACRCKCDCSSHFLIDVVVVFLFLLLF